MTGLPATHSFVLVSRSITKRSPAQHFETIHGRFFPYFQGSCPYTCHENVYCIEALGRGEWSALRSGCFYSREEGLFGTHRLRVLVDLRDGLGGFGEEMCLLFRQGFELRTVQLVS